MRVLIIISCVLMFSCSDKKKNISPGKEVLEVVENTKKVFFKWPKDGSSVASPVFIDMGVEGMQIEPAGVVKEGYGHHHILINQK